MKYLLLVLSFLKIAYCVCPDGCRCSDLVTNCSRLDLTTFSFQMSSTAEQLILSYNLISVINLIDYENEDFPYSENTILKNLSMSHNNLNDDVLSFVSHFTSLEYLDLSYNKISLLEDFSFPHSLHYIDISFNQIRYVSSDCFDSLDELKYLDFRGVDLTKYPNEIFKHLINLEQIKLGGKNLSELRNKVFKRNQEFQKFNFLTRLQIENSKINDFHKNLLKYFPNLAILDVSNNQLNTFPPEFFLKATNLKHLRLSGNSFSSSDELANLIDNLNLTNLDVSFNLYRDSISTIVARQPYLETLNMSHNKVENLKENFFSNSLKEIDFSFNFISFVSYNAFSACSSLQDLHLTGNKLTSLPYLNLSQHLDISIDQNLWNCTCALYQALLKPSFKTSYLKYRCFDTSDLSCLKCSYSSGLINTPVINLKSSCIENEANSVSGTIAAVVLILLFLVFCSVLCWIKGNKVQKFFSDIKISKFSSVDQQNQTNELYMDLDKTHSNQTKPDLNMAKTSSLSVSEVNQKKNVYFNSDPNQSNHFELNSHEPESKVHSETSNIVNADFHHYQSVKRASNDREVDLYSMAEQDSNPYALAESPSLPDQESMNVYNDLQL